MHPKLWGCTPVQAISKIQDQGGMVGIAEQLQFCETPKKQLLYFFFPWEALEPTELTSFSGYHLFQG